MTRQLSSFLGHAQGKILYTETSMLCAYRTEFLGYTQRKMLYAATSSNEFLGSPWENAAYRHQQPSTRVFIIDSNLTSI